MDVQSTVARPACPKRHDALRIARAGCTRRAAARGSPQCTRTGRNTPAARRAARLAAYRLSRTVETGERRTQFRLGERRRHRVAMIGGWAPPTFLQRTI